jgi:hypothetical protein
MPDIDPHISDFNHRVSLCTMLDVVDKDGVMQLTRKPIATCWAIIYSQPHLPSFIAPFGYAVKELAERVTHLITIKAAVGVDFTSSAWLYEERRKSLPRWYKVLGFYDRDHWITLHCHLVERSVNVTPPKPTLDRLAAEPSEI